MPSINLPDDVYDELCRRAIEKMKPKETLEEGIIKVLRELLGLKQVDNLSIVLNEIPPSQRANAEDLINELQSLSLKFSLPSDRAWEEGYRWIGFKVPNPTGRKELAGSLEPRRYGFIVYVFNPQGDYDRYKIGQSHRYPDVKQEILDRIKEAIEYLTS